MTEEEFVKAAWDLKGRKVAKAQLLRDIYLSAKTSVALPVPPTSDAITAMQVVLEEYLGLLKRRADLETMAHEKLAGRRDYEILRSVPGIGPITALTVIAESGDLRRFKHYKQFLKYCGLDLSTHQSGQYRGRTALSKRGNSRLRSAFWMAATVAIRQRENSFRAAYERLIAPAPKDADRKRIAYTAIAVKMARVAHSLVKQDQFYRPYPVEAVTGGGIPFNRAVGAERTP
jgi:transposase